MCGGEQSKNVEFLYAVQVKLLQAQCEGVKEKYPMQMETKREQGCYT